MSLFTGAAGPRAWWERLRSALKFHWPSELSFLYATPLPHSLSCSLSLTFSHTKTLCDIKRCFAWIDHNTQPFTVSFPPPVVLLPWPIRYLSRKPAFPLPACTTAIHPFILWFLLSTNGFGTTGPYSPHASAHHNGWHAACAIIILGCICKEVVSLSCRSRNIGLSKLGVHMQIFLAESTTGVFFPSLKHGLKSATSKSCFKVYLAIIPHHTPLCPLESGRFTTKREHTTQSGRAKGKTGLSLYLFFFSTRMVHGACVCAWYGSTQVNTVTDDLQCIVLKCLVVCSVRHLRAGGVYSLDSQASLLFGHFNLWK